MVRGRGRRKFVVCNLDEMTGDVQDRYILDATRDATRGNRRARRGASGPSLHQVNTGTAAQAAGGDQRLPRRASPDGFDIVCGAAGLYVCGGSGCRLIKEGRFRAGPPRRT
jgi:hypothetical protein